METVEPEVLFDDRDEEAHHRDERESRRRERTGERYEDDEHLAAKAEVVEGLRQMSEDADQAAALVEVVEEVGEVGVEAALAPKEDNLNLVRAGLWALLDYARGGGGRSPLQPEPRKKRRRG